MFNSIRVRKLAQTYHGQLDSAENFKRVAVKFENQVFHEANSKVIFFTLWKIELISNLILIQYDQSYFGM